MCRAFKMKRQALIRCLALPAVLFSAWAMGQTTPGALETYATQHSIGIEWDISGDANHNAECLVSYRPQGEIEWRTAQPLFRVDFEAYDMLAGSVLFLQPGTTYEVRLQLSDVDGGAQTRTETVTTQAVPVMPTTGSTHHVVPGSGGGDGSAGNPFQGIAAAQAVAQPGDVFLLHAGDYGTAGQVFFTASGAPGNPIVWRNAGDGDAVFNQIRIEADHLWLHGLNLVLPDGNNDYGIRTSPPGPDHVVLTRNLFLNCHYCIYLNDGGSNWTIVDNTIVGNNDPASGSNFSGEGIELWHTSGHTVAYNRISRVADGISYPHRNVDIFGNEIFDATDDGIEADFGHANVRIWGNRITNVYNNGLSFQPMDGAPWYVLFNQVLAPNEDALKLRTRTDRVLLAHNTLVAWSGPVSASSDLIKNFTSLNNIWVSVQDRYIWENGGDGSLNFRTRLDYDGFDWGNFIYAFKWGDVRLPDIVDFQNMTGQEMHAVHIDRSSCFQQFDVPAAPPGPQPFQHLSLTAGCNAVDAGLALANINDGFIGAAPDLGALERNAPLPQYGPRALQDDLIFIDGFD